MIYISSSKKNGYQTFIAESDDLLHWKKLGRILSFNDSTKWDAWQAAGGIALCDFKWGGSYEPEKLTLYKSQIIRDKSKSLGSQFVMYYNAKTK